MTPTERATVLRTLRWSIRTFAARAGVTEGTVRLWQAGRGCPRADVDQRLARAARLIAPLRAREAVILAEWKCPTP